MVHDSVRSVSSSFVLCSSSHFTSKECKWNEGVKPWSLVTKGKTLATKGKDLGDQRETLGDQRERPW